MIVDAAIYKYGQREPGPFDFEEAGRLRGDPATSVWVGLYEPTEEEFEAARKAFDLHPLAVEDAVNAHQRPKLETYGQTLFVVANSWEGLGVEGERTGQVLTTPAPVPAAHA